MNSSTESVTNFDHRPALNRSTRTLPRWSKEEAWVPLLRPLPLSCGHYGFRAITRSTRLMLAQGRLLTFHFSPFTVRCLLCGFASLREIFIRCPPRLRPCEGGSFRSLLSIASASGESTRGPSFAAVPYSLRVPHSRNFFSTWSRTRDRATDRSIPLSSRIS